LKIPVYRLGEMPVSELNHWIAYLKIINADATTTD
jgi:hypothetical protein